MKAGRTAWALIAASALLPSSASAEEVFWTTKSLLKDFFKSSERVSYVTLETAAIEKPLRDILGYRPSKDKYVVFVAKSGDRVDGYAIVDEEKGQHEPITFGVKLRPDGTVDRAEVMVYREGYGGEIREARFRTQFEGAGIDQPIRCGDDIVAISGATISSKSMSIAVRRAVALVSLVQKQQAGPAHSVARSSP
jgi:Na+-translocating ferredoxin:NAD+ oxidoreductase subunit G